MSEDWIGRPLDLLLGYTPGMSLPTVRTHRDRQWHPEDARPDMDSLRRLRSEDAWAEWRAKKLIGHRWHRLTQLCDRQLADDARMVRARRVVAHMIATGRVDMTDIADDADRLRAEGAMTVLVSIASNVREKASDRVAAAKAVLDFTRQKPASKTDVKVNALDWLNGIASDAEAT